MTGFIWRELDIFLVSAVLQDLLDAHFFLSKNGYFTLLALLRDLVDAGLFRASLADT